LTNRSLTFLDARSSAVNDVDLLREHLNGTLKLKVGRVDIGLRGAIRRLLKGLAPSRAVEALAMRMPEKSIPWKPWT